jgi:hypothetical protein
MDSAIASFTKKVSTFLFVTSAAGSKMCKGFLIQDVLYIVSVCRHLYFDTLYGTSLKLQ